ncbi:MAG: hypothetical protein J5552_06905 [Prevotella sp.]|nr:hypothetical protein [Prevotella sp.]
MKKGKVRKNLARAAMTLLLAALCSTGAWAAGDICVAGARYTLFNAGYKYIASSLPNAWYNTPNGENEEVVCKRLFDGDKSTKWVYVPSGTSNSCPTLTIDFQVVASNNFYPVVKGYILVTGDDTETYTNRNPTKWKLYGSNDINGTWTKIDERNTSSNSADKLPLSNLAEKSYMTPNNNTGYTYYRLEITDVNGRLSSDESKYKCQLNELILFGNSEYYNNNTLNNYTIGGLENALTWTGNDLAPDYYVHRNGTHLSPSNYRSGITPSRVRDAGFYTLTIYENSSNYPGEKSVIFRVAKPLEGEGTEESPYLINDYNDWNAFAEKVTYDNANYGDKYYKLTSDITVTTMVGSSGSPFKGHFDGDGHTLTLDLSAADFLNSHNLSADGTCRAPFRYVSGTSSSPISIRRLHTTGTVTAGSAVLDDVNMHRSGLIGQCNGYVNIDNCWSSVNITSSLAREGGHSGFIGKSYSNSVVKINNCLFDGTITGSTTTRCGGFVGGGASNVTIKNCLMAGTLDISIDPNDTKNSATFSRITLSSDSKKNYYVNSYGTVQGTDVGEMTNDELLAALGNQWEILGGKVVPIIDTKNLKLGTVECSTNWPWTGEEISVVPTIKDVDGNLVDAANYTVSFSPSPVQAAGDYTMTVTGSANGYRGTLTHLFTVSTIPKGMYQDGETLAINMPKSDITTLDLSQFSVNSFKVYDDGGKNNNYTTYCTGSLKIIAPEGRLIRISGNVKCASSGYLKIYDGGTRVDNIIIGKSRFGSTEGENIGTLTSTGQEMLLYFYTSSPRYEGLDLTVTLIDASTEYDITVVNLNTERGTVSVNPALAAANTDITVSVAPASGYRLCDLQAADAFGNRIDLSHLLWYNNTSTGTFKMASSDVTITPTFTNVWTAEGGLYVNMPKSGETLTVNLDTETPSVKIYDDGGKDHNNSYNCDGYLLLTAPQGYSVKLTGTMDTGALKAYDGSTAVTQLISRSASGEPKSIGSVLTTGTQMLIRFNSTADYYAGIDLTASIYNPNTENNITVVNPVTGGTVTSLVEIAKYGDEVALNITLDTGYVLESIEVKDADNNIISTGDWTWYDVGSTVKFTMPSSDVTVTPTFTDCPSINIKNTGSNLSNAMVMDIPAGLMSFKVYDDGGKDGNYSPGTFHSYTLFNVPQGYCMKVKGTVKTYNYNDELKIYDDNSTNSLLGSYVGTKDVGELFTTSNQMLLYFNGFDSNVAEGFELTVNVFNPATLVTLNNNATNNSTTIANNDGNMTSVQLSNRTFYQNGDWNTICLPFDMTLSGTPLAGANVKTLTDASFEDGTLNLTFGDNTTELTAGTPYIIRWEPADLVINNKTDWDNFVGAVNGHGNTFENKVVRLAADIDGVTSMVGTSLSSYKFKGTFDGNGHTLTLNLQANGDYCAPFRYVDGATIKNLHTAGTVNAGTYKFGSGLVGESRGTVTIQNCRSSVTINSSVDGDGTHGGFVGVENSGSVTLTNCLFDGTISGSATTSCGGFMGWHATQNNNTYPVTFENCLMAGTLDISIDENSATFTRNGDVGTTIINCYYTTALTNNGVNQGDPVVNMNNDELANALGSGWQVSAGGVMPRIITLVDPTFLGVKINKTVNDQVFDLGSGKSITFKGTYDKLSYDEDTPSILFLGAANTLYYPQNGASIGACRAYFELGGITAGDVSGVRMFFGNGSEETGIVNVERSTFNVQRLASDAWFDLNGRKLNGVPTAKGVYIHGGHKVVVK